MSNTKLGKVIVGMSGGVDSSVAAYLLLQQGFEVEGLFMKNWEEDDNTEYCTARQDWADAQQVSDQLQIPLHGANFAAEYWDNVFEHFLAEYRAGRTPNPDILCNKEIKFKAFLEYALELGADYIATGHYVRKFQQHPNQAQLLRGLDNNKDQSYFLYAVPGRQLAKALFPLGELAKPEVRNVPLDTCTAHGVKATLRCPICHKPLCPDCDQGGVCSERCRNSREKFGGPISTVPRKSGFAWLWTVFNWALVIGVVYGVTRYLGIDVVGLIKGLIPK